MGGLLLFLDSSAEREKIKRGLAVINNGGAGRYDDAGECGVAAI